MAIRLDEYVPGQTAFEGQADTFVECPALTIKQPWASLIAMGQKRYETRSWHTKKRGKIAIHAGSAWDIHHAHRAKALGFSDTMIQAMPVGRVVCFADLMDCITMDAEFIAAQTPRERELGHWEPGRVAWKFGRIWTLPESFHMSGKQGLWTARFPEALIRGMARGYS